MKKILVAGARSFVGRSFAGWLERFGGRYRTDFVSLRGAEWRRRSFAGYDALIHCAGIAHLSAGPDELYLRVNRDLAEETALKARREGVGQFVFMSSIAV
ncbi:MAG: NAD-dependent epimerase, partial [Pyramidobacter porci]|nr:NAD-dependent epimerase [Pyramidobacter porci]